MAINTAQKRFSMMDFGMAWAGGRLPVPDGSNMDTPGQRQMLLGAYSGIDFGTQGSGWVEFGDIGGTSIDGDGTMGTIFLNDATPVPADAINITGIAHHTDGRRYVALWPADEIIQNEAGIALRPDGAMIIAPAGVATQNYGITALTYRGEVLVSIDAPQAWAGGFGHRYTGAMCMSNIS